MNEMCLCINRNARPTNIFQKVPIIKKTRTIFNRFDGTIIIKIAEGDNLTNINVFSMILVRAITSSMVIADPY